MFTQRCSPNSEGNSPKYGNNIAGIAQQQFGPNLLQRE